MSQITQMAGNLAAMESPHPAASRIFEAPPEPATTAPPAVAMPPATTLASDGALTTTLENVTQRIQHLELQQLPEAERLQRSLSQVTSERDHAQSELRNLKRVAAVRRWAEESGFTEPEYLDFLFRNHGVDPEDSAAGTAFLQHLSREQARFFAVRIHPGAGSNPARSAKLDATHDSGGAAGRNVNDISALLMEAPEIN